MLIENQLPLDGFKEKSITGTKSKQCHQYPKKGVERNSD